MTGNFVPEKIANQKTEIACQAYIDAAFQKETLSDEEIEKLQAAIDLLQQEAGQRFETPHRELWVSYQIALLHAHAKRWEKAADLDHVFGLARSHNQDGWVAVLTKLEQDIKSHLE